MQTKALLLLAKRQLKFALLLMLISISSTLVAQTLQLKGTVLDTSGQGAMERATILLIRLSDSTLTRFTRTNALGEFNIKNAPIDTYQVVIQHPFSSDKEIILVSSAENKDFDLGRIALPPLSRNLKEVTILGYKDPIYFKGDTLVFVADSFKVKQNATVEDLLKKLPGIQVDGQGKIKSQGKEVSRVLVDGDEFFGSDPTTATRNLAATNIESVNVYEKKNENAEAGSADDKITVMDLKLKEDAKKGYFGKAEGGTDFNRFYESKLLANRFSNKQKISVSGLFSNTPSTSFGWEASRYGVEDDNFTRVENDDESYSYYSNEAIDGIPTTKKAGIYYNNKFSDKSKLNANYTFKENTVDALKETNAQYFLADTSFFVNNTTRSFQFNNSHTINLKWEQKLDSLSTLFIEPSFKQQEATNRSENISEFLSSDKALARQTTINNVGAGKTLAFAGKIKLQRNFMKKNRQLNLQYYYGNTASTGQGNLKTINQYSDDRPDSLIDQRKFNTQDDYNHKTQIQFTEPLGKKLKLNLEYELTYSANQQNKETFNTINGDYTLRDSILSNVFETKRSNNLAAASFVYETKKYTIRLGTKARNNFARNENIDKQSTLIQNINNVLPFASYSYKPKETSNFRLSVSTNSTSPSLAQLQPVPNNTNPNFIMLGNPNLLPTYEQKAELNFYAYSPLKGNNLWSGAAFTRVENGFSNALVYDSLGRSISTPINVDGNYFGYAYAGMYYNIWGKKLSLNPNLNYSGSSNTNLVNSQKNTTKSQRISASFSVNLDLEKTKAGLFVEGSYNNTATTLNQQANLPYTSTKYGASLEQTLSKKLVLSTDVNYFTNSRRSAGYNLNYLIWNAELGHKFLSKENLIISAQAYDILNQNISVSRSISNNTLVDSKTNIIGRYLLLKLTYKFDSNKENLQSNDDF